jgi:SAM-dependent methyltransferase
MSVYDAMATDFNRRRALPDGVPETVRDTILGAGLPPRPRILDLGAGSGRIGRTFVLAGDDYIGADLSFGMLRAFAGDIVQVRGEGAAGMAAVPVGPRLARADGARLPFADAAFDAVLLIQVLSGVPGWRHLLADALRVLRRAGVLIVGRVVAPDDGIDAQMKSRLALILDEMDLHPYRDKPRDDALSWLARQMPDRSVVTAANWTAERTPAAFIERHGSGARFAKLDEPVRQQAMHELAGWARDRFGPLDVARAEIYRFELIFHRFPQGAA